MAKTATKEKKREIVTELGELFSTAKLAVIADLSGFTVAEITGFRRKLAIDQAKCRVTKNTLLKIVTKDNEFAPLESLAKGPTAVILGYQDPAAAAKATINYLKDIKKGLVRGGVFEGKLLSENEVKALASLPSKEQLLSSIMGSMDAPARDVAGCLAAVIRDIAVLVEEVAKKKEAA